jgi:hypothetical protein
MLKMYHPRHADYVRIPKISASAPNFRVGNIIAPDRDIDDTLYWWLEFIVPRVIWRNIFPVVFNCVQGTVREYDFDDNLDKGEINTWAPLVAKGKRKEDFILSFYENYTLFDGKTPMYPAKENNLGSFFLKGDEWDDGLEKAMVFDLIGVHRVEQTSKTIGGETLPFVLALNAFSKFETRPGFGKYGGDMYFTSDGLPALIITPDGREVKRGAKDWQYWKFVFRSSLVSIITLVDHLHLTHYRAANMIAKVSRRTLPPNHPNRRLVSIFTFGSIFINNLAHHMLIGQKSPLHRATAFKDFTGLSKLVPKMMKSVAEFHAPLVIPSEWEKLPTLIKNSPYFADGRLLVDAMMRMSDGMYEAFSGDICENNTVVDEHLLDYMAQFHAEEDTGGYAHALTAQGNIPCDLVLKRQVGFLWTLTGWHRHVGMVADFVSDPDLAGFSWKDGERSTRPLQAMIMSVVGAVTGTPHPKINEDFTHLFQDIKSGDAIAKVWKDFQKDLGEVEKEIARRNEKRRIKNFHASPSVVECSVAV